MDTLNFILGIFPYLLQGTINTFTIALFSFILGFFLAVLLTPSNIFRVFPLYQISRSYIEVIRGTPLLVQLFILYFGLPSLGIKFDALTAAWLALGLNSAAYQAEILRTAIKSIPESQFYSAESLGLSNLQIYRYVILPQAVRIAVPSYVNEFVTLIKESSLASVIGVVELTRRGEYVVAFTFRAFEVYLAVAIIYFVICFASSHVARMLEKKFAIPGYRG